MRLYKFSWVFVVLSLGVVAALTQKQRDLRATKLKDDEFDRMMHDGGSSKTVKLRGFSGDEDEELGTNNFFRHEKDNSFWYKSAQQVLKEKLGRPLNTNVAKNVIVFLGDGMSVPTLMAARTYLGQLEGKPGEEGSLYWEQFPYTGLSKTWCVDKQVADSACTSTAYLGGVKTRWGTVGLNANVVLGDCDTQVKENHVNSIAKWAQDHGKGTGIVTTTRVTHASPAGAYAHAADRNWESDTDVFGSGYNPKQCQDIATQLVHNDPGKNFKVILGGGRRNFLPNTTIDEEGDQGLRSDGVNLIDEWARDKHQRRSRHAYLWNRTALDDVRKHPDNYDHVLGLFESSHCQYNLETSPDTEPTLAEMTEAAVKILSKEKNGFFLFVEGGRIDHAHHGNWATLALDETVELAKAVRTAREMTSESDTLIVVTADHAHTMSVSGYPKRGNPINNVVGTLADDRLHYPTLTYANGPGYKQPNVDGSRYDPSAANYGDPRYQSIGLAPLKSETHGGEDVAIFSSGPWAHLFTGTIDQSNIPHFLGYASCIGKSDLSACTTRNTRPWQLYANRLK